MASPRQPLGPYLGNAGETIQGGALYFLDPTTDTPKTLYADEDKTILAANPIFLDSASCTPYQLFYGEGGYKVQKFELIDPEMQSPTFPNDYVLLKEWLDEAYPTDGGSIGGGSYITVDTILDITDNVDPNDDTMVQVLGYYDRNDQIDARFYYWDALSVLAPDGGAVLSSNLTGTGRWILKNESPVIDVRWFGSIPSSGVDSNAGLTSATAFASSNSDSPKTVFMPSGNYQFSPASINISCPIEIAKGVFFFLPNAGNLTLNFNDRYDIGINVDPLIPTSLGELDFDFTGTTAGLDYYDLIDPIWYGDDERAFSLSGGNPVLISKAKTIDVSISGVGANLVFREAGVLTTTGSGYLYVLNCVSDNNNKAIFTNSASPVNHELTFDSGLNVYSKWFSSNDALRYATLTGCNLILNDTKASISGYEFDFTSLASVRSESGYVDVYSGGELKLPSSLIGKVVRSESTTAGAVEISGNAFTSLNWVLNNADAVKGFCFASAEQCNARVQFNGECIAFDVDFTGLNPMELALVSFNGAFVFDGYIELNSSVLLGSVTRTGTSSTLKLTNSTLAPTNGPITYDNLLLIGSSISSNTLITCTSFYSKGSTIDASITAGVFNCYDSDVTEVVLTPSLNAGGFFDFEIKNNRLAGGYILPNGTGLSNRSYIVGNDFQFPSSEDPNAFLYVPINDTNFNVTGETISAYSGTYPIAYNVLVAENTPQVEMQGIAPPTNGTMLKQTKIKGRANFNWVFTLSNRMLLPYVANEMIYSSMTSGCMTITSPTNQVTLNFDKWVSDDGFGNQTITTLLDANGTPSDFEGYSYEIDLYPQRNL